ncbi:MAG: TraB/GumN family protein [Pseudomonadota bacterium]
MKKLLQRLFTPVAALLTLGSAGPAAAKGPAVKPALWAIADADTTIYLFGTIHVLPEKYQWRTTKFDRAVEGSGQLVVETIVDEKNPTGIVAAMQKLAFSPGLPPIAERVPPAKRKALAAAIAKSGVPRAAFDNMETWAAGFLLLGNQFKQMGLQGGQGVEAVLRSDFLSDGKPIGELETNIEQLGYFDRLSEKAQRNFLEGAIMEVPSTKKQFSGMLSAWARGDVAAIARSFDKDLESSPEMKQALMKQRNANWSRWIEDRMTKPGTIMLAVGAGHLAGKDSVIELLKRDGYTVSRVQ